MKFIYSRHYQEIQKIVDSELFSELILFLNQQQKPPILRELKQVFPQKNFEKTLDQLIAAGVIGRSDRRYHINFPIYSKEDQQRSREGRQLVGEPSAELDFLLRSGNNHRFFYACEKDVVQGYMYQLTHESFQLVSLSQERWPATIPAFFAANRQLLSLPVYQEMLSLIGDVDEAYYLDQISVIFERVTKQRKIRSSIFLTSLVQATILLPDHSFNLPLVDAALLKENSEDLMVDFSEFDRRTWLADYLEKTADPQTILIV
ncbi:DUF1803 domain-containing protein [Enterococcus sp.]|uniref:DUF1803 domain-containing protein n=1 Tax=Enterococcus sp. TaxID=35783 RepID=UPI0025C0D0A0|nr:DUF1803 domain-containing protein [Enterococcus sp.]